MKKKFDTANITNELEGASLFFTRPISSPPLPQPETPATEKKEKPLAVSLFFGKTSAPLPQAQKEENQDQKRTNVPSDVRTNSKPKRQKIRHAFDIYQDQLMSLQMRQLEAVQRGKRKPKLGKMVQDAIDLFLKRAKDGKK